MPVHGPRTAGATLAAGRLGVPAVASFALTAAAPIMVVGGYVTTAWAVTGTVAVSTALMIMAVLLAVWSVGYVTMSRHVTNAGSLYTYLAHGLGPRVAVAGAGVQLSAYSLMQWGLYGIGGVQGAAVIRDLTGVDAPWWLWALIAWGVVTLLGTRGVGVSSTVLAIAVVAELAVVGVVAVVDLTHPAGGHITFTALNPMNLSPAALGVTLAIAVTAFVGVEGAPIYSEESRQPKSTVRIATFVALGLMTVAYVLGSWAMTVAVGPSRVVETATQQGPDMLLLPASEHAGGSMLVNAGHFLLLTSVFAGLLSYHNAVARCAFALGREEIAPRLFGRTSPATGAPINASLAQSATGLVVILLFALGGLDPMTQLFFAGGTTGALGILILLTAVSAAIVKFFARNRRGENPWAALVAPTIGAITLGGCLILVLTNYAKLLGVAPTSPARWALPTTYLVAAILAGGYAIWLGIRRPSALRRAGHGANAVLTPAPAWDTTSIGATAR